MKMSAEEPPAFRHAGPARAAAALSRIWRDSGFETFAERFEQLASAFPEVGVEQISELRSPLGGDLRKIWAALEMVRRRRTPEIDDQRLLALWRTLVPGDRFPGLLELFPDQRSRDRVEDALRFYVVGSVEHRLASDEGAGAPLGELPYWLDWEEWATRHGAPWTATAGTAMERLVAEHSSDARVAALRYRELADLAHRRGEPVFAYRLTFQRELAALARVGADAQQRRLEELISGLVEPTSSQDEIDSRLKALRFFLARPPRELLESGEANGKALLSLILLALVFRTSSGEAGSVAQVLQRLGLTASDFVGLIEADVQENAGTQDWQAVDCWAELLFDELLRRVQGNPTPEDDLRLTFEACLRLTWRIWSRSSSRSAESGLAEFRLARILEMRSRLRSAPGDSRQLLLESVPPDRQPAALAVLERTRSCRSRESSPG